MVDYGPMFIPILLQGGPCDGQIVHVTPAPGGSMPRCFQACTPAPPRDITEPPGEPHYHTYMRIGGSRSVHYMYWRDALTTP